MLRKRRKKVVEKKNLGEKVSGRIKGDYIYGCLSLGSRACLFRQVALGTAVTKNPLIYPISDQMPYSRVEKVLKYEYLPTLYQDHITLC